MAHSIGGDYRAVRHAYATVMLVKTTGVQLAVVRKRSTGFASNNRMAGTQEANRAIVQSSIAYFARYSLDENERKIHLHYDGSTFRTGTE